MQAQREVRENWDRRNVPQFETAWAESPRGPEERLLVQKTGQVRLMCKMCSGQSSSFTPLEAGSKDPRSNVLSILAANHLLSGP